MNRPAISNSTLSSLRILLKWSCAISAAIGVICIGLTFAMIALRDYTGVDVFLLGIVYYFLPPLLPYIGLAIILLTVLQKSSLPTFQKIVLSLASFCLFLATGLLSMQFASWFTH